MKSKSEKPPASTPAKPKGKWESMLRQAMEKKKPSSAWPERAAHHMPDGKGKVRGRGGSR